MKLLASNKWKKRLPFDNVIYKDVRRHSLQLSALEREIMNVQIDFYRTHFSLEQVMVHFRILKTPEEKETFIKAVLKRLDNVLYIPVALNGYYKKIIKEEFAEYRAFFEIVLNRSLEQKHDNLMLPIYKKIFGEYYKCIVKDVNKYYKQKPFMVSDRVLKPEAQENTARDIIKSIQDDLYLAAIYGRSTVRRSVPISVVDDYGYGEWTSKNVSFATNRFYLYANHDKLTKLQLEYMIYLNVYPGYGHFYNTVLDEPHNICFDNGATYLINGWGMYASCFSKNSPYATNRLVEACTIAHHLLGKNLEKAFENVYVYLLSKYTKAQAQEYLASYSQFPGDYMSYVLGALATFECIKVGFANNPLDYLNTLKDINCGDFFALYSPKMQRKIAKTTITAKVSPKFLQ